MKRLLLLLAAGITGWWGYRRLRSHPRTAGKVAEIERQSQVVVDKASEAVRSATGQVVSKAAGLADTASTGAQDAIGAATGKAHDALDAAMDKTRQAISPVQGKLADLRGDASASAGAEHPAS
jgi:hypothetical protein